MDQMNLHVQYSFLTLHRKKGLERISWLCEMEMIWYNMMFFSVTSEKQMEILNEQYFQYFLLLFPVFRILIDSDLVRSVSPDPDPGGQKWPI